jgi:anti-sigma-K factor RskA
MSGEEEMYDELLGAYALDAVDEDERRAVEDYLKVNPRAVAEVQEHREVAAMLAWSTMAPPDGLWERIAGSLDEAAPVPTGDLARVIPMAVPRRRRLNAVSTWAMAAAAAVVVLALGIAAFRNTSSTTSSQSLMEQAAKRDDAQTITLHSTDGTATAKVVVDGEGHGFVQAGTLPGLASDRTYQLWGLIDGQPISLGVLGHRPGVEMFSVDGNLTVLMISNEAAGGVPTDANTTGLLTGKLV